jgi:hypothetical protein
MEGINNTIWGPVYWKMFHYVTLTYPLAPKQEDANRMKFFFTELVPHIIPCPLCRSHYSKNLQINPLTDDILEIKFKFVIWLINMHNYVNKQLGKDEMSVEDALVSLFVPENKKEENHNPHLAEKKYTQEKLKDFMNNIIHFKSDNYIYDINEIIAEKEKIIENKKREEKILEEQKAKVLENTTPEELEKRKKAEEDKKQYFENLAKMFKSKKIEDNFKEVEIKKQETINMNLVVEKILNHIENCNDNYVKYQIYSGFESICFIFN